MSRKCPFDKLPVPFHYGEPEESADILDAADSYPPKKYQVAGQGRADPIMSCLSLPDCNFARNLGGRKSGDRLQIHSSAAAEAVNKKVSFILIF